MREKLRKFFSELCGRFVNQMINKLPGTKSFSDVFLIYAANSNAAYVKTSCNVSSRLKTIIKIACGIARKQASDLIT